MSGVASGSYSISYGRWPIGCLPSRLQWLGPHVPAPIGYCVFKPAIRVGNDVACYGPLGHPRWYVKVDDRSHCGLTPGYFDVSAMSAVVWNRFRGEPFVARRLVFVRDFAERLYQSMSLLPSFLIMRHPHKLAACFRSRCC